MLSLFKLLIALKDSMWWNILRNLHDSLSIIKCYYAIIWMSFIRCSGLLQYSMYSVGISILTLYCSKNTDTALKKQGKSLAFNFCMCAYAALRIVPFQKGNPSCAQKKLFSALWCCIFKLITKMCQTCADGLWCHHAPIFGFSVWLLRHAE